MIKKDIASKMTGYGHTFSNERDFDAYKKYQAEKRQRARRQKQNMSQDEKERASIRKHFAAEAKKFNIKI